MNLTYSAHVLLLGSQTNSVLLRRANIKKYILKLHFSSCRLDRLHFSMFQNCCAFHHTQIRSVEVVYTGLVANMGNYIDFYIHQNKSTLKSIFEFHQTQFLSLVSIFNLEIYIEINCFYKPAMVAQWSNFPCFKFKQRHALRSQV